MKNKNKSYQRTNTNYPVGDFLIRLKNAGIAGHKEVLIAKSKQIKAVAEVLKKAGFLDQVEEKEGNLSVSLSYRKKLPVLLDVKLISKPGLRVYIGIEELEKKKGPSVLLLSTSFGVMTAKDAIKKKIGGEIIAAIL